MLIKTKKAGGPVNWISFNFIVVVTIWTDTNVHLIFFFKNEVWFQHLSGGNEKTTRNSSQDSMCFGQDSNQAPREYKTRALPLHEPADYTLHFNYNPEILKDHGKRKFY